VPPCGTSIGPDVLERDALVRRRRAPRLLGRLVDLTLRLGLDRYDRLLVDAEVEQPLPIAGDRILREPLFDLVLGPILAGIGARVAAVTIRLGLDETRAAAPSGGVERAQRGRVDDVDVVAVDEDRLEAVRARSIRGRMLDGRDLVDRGVFHVAVVLAHEYDRQLPHDREI